MTYDYHKPYSLRDFIVGKGRDGRIHVKRYTLVTDNYHSDFPLWDFTIETLGL